VEYIERERHAVAIHEACHAVVAFRTRRHLEIDLATIEKGSDYLGMVAAIPPEDQFTRWRSEYQADIFVSLASLAGERIFFDGDSSSGVSGDLESATSVASYMEGFWGMGSTVSSYSTAKRLEVGAPGGGQAGKRAKGQNPEAELRRALADRIEDNLADLLERTARLLREHRRDILVLAHALETHKTLTGDDVAAVLDGRVGPTVDGSPYAMPEFMKEIEAYHKAAVLAHQSHSGIMLSLPVAPDPQVTAIAASSVWAAPTAIGSDQRPPVPGSGDHGLAGS
jgi:ATP-dependent Zn protease